METFLIGSFGKAVVHIRPLVVLALSGGEKVFCGVANAVQLFEPQLGVFLLIISGFEEQCRDLLKAFLCVSKVIRLITQEAESTHSSPGYRRNSVTSRPSSERR